MDTPITRAEHEEFRRTVEAEFENLSNEDKRINKRLEALEKVTGEINNLARSVDKLTQSIAQMCKTQEADDKRLTELESRDGEMWRKVLSYTITATISIVLGFLFAHIGIT